MEIAICDDDLKTVGWLESLLNREFGHMEHFRCDTFLSGEELMHHLSTTSLAYSVYLLDIEMGRLNGLKAAERIRKTDRNAIIIFVTSHKELMQEAFEVLAFQYLVKPLSEASVLRVLKKACTYLSTSRSLFHFRFNKVRYSIPSGDICYFESIKRLVCIHTEQKEYEYYDTMKELLKKLDSTLFVRVHAAYIVNLEHVESFNGKYIMLHSQSGIPVSKTYLKSFNESYKKYIWMRME